MKTYLKSQGLWKDVKTDESTPALGKNRTVATVAKLGPGIAAIVVMNMLNLKSVRMSLSLEKKLPLRSGLGSSAASAAAAVVAVNEIFDHNNTQGIQQENVFKEDQVVDEHLVMASHLDKHPNSLTWLMDSGCTSHMTLEWSFFISLDTKDNPRVKLGDGCYARAKGRGTIAINTKKGTKYIYRVLYVPELDRSMLSVPQMIKNGYGVNFKNDSRCVITDSRDYAIASLDMVNYSYYLKLDVANASDFSVTKDDSLKWHKIFGCFNYKTLKHMYTTKLVKDMPPISEVDYKYKGCELVKIHRLPFSKAGVTRATHKLEIVHSNICGTMSTPSWRSNKYTKRQYFAYSEGTDNGGVYTSNEFENFLQQQGVIHQVTVLYSPQQNDFSKRKNKTVIEMKRSMLFENKLPLTFWAEAVATSLYLLNILATKAMSGKTPVKSWSGIKPSIQDLKVFRSISYYPSIQHLKVFRSILYYRIPDIKRSKLDAKARKGIFVGYATESKEYRISDLTESKFAISKDVTFDEDAYWDRNVDEVKRHEDTRSSSESTLYVKRFNSQERLIISLYVDDFLMIGINDHLIKEFKKQMESKFVYKCKLSKDDGKRLVNPTQFRSIVGSLLYLTISRRDLAFADSLLSKFMGELSSSHLGAAKKVLRYVKGSLDLRIMFERNKVVKHEGCADSDWAGSIDNSKSTSGYIFALGSGVFCWNSKKQSIVVQSSAETEYISAVGAVNHAIWIRKLFSDLDLSQEGPTSLLLL
ncbi:retrovirus-related pol polyprotein from transposon TNT 1-94 [Tanacetum coccineum]